jgi:hypothetical protein
MSQVSFEAARSEPTASDPPKGRWAPPARGYVARRAPGVRPRPERGGLSDCAVGADRILPPRPGVEGLRDRLTPTAHRVEAPIPTSGPAANEGVSYHFGRVV